MKLLIKPFRAYAVGPGFTLCCPSGVEAATGRVTLVRGDSGSGKSVLLRILAGLLPPDVIAMEVHPAVGAEPVPLAEFCAEETRRSYLPQQSVLRDYLTPGRALDAWCDVLASTCPRGPDDSGSVCARKDELVRRLFTGQERAQLFAARGAPRIRHLSGGQKRRLDVVMALCSPAEVILLDEPDSGLDEAARGRLLETLLRVAADDRKLLVMVSHLAGAAAVGEDIDVWTVRRHAEGGGATLDAVAPAPAPRPPLNLHRTSDERGDLRLDHFLIYLRQRLWAVPTGKGLAALLTPVLMMALVRLAIYPGEAHDAPSLALLFFFAVTCFWMGAIQATAFWADEQVFFHRECRQGASSLAFLASFLTVTAAVGAAQAGLAALVTRYVNWAGILTPGPADPASDLSVGPGRLFGWGAWAALNGVLIGLFWSTLQYRWRPRLTSTATAQILALCITLTTIVFSFPIIGRRAYAEVTADPDTPDRSTVIRDAWRGLTRPDVPAAAILLAELPVGVNPSFHGLWFQAERPLRLGLPAPARDQMQKFGVPEGAWNAAILGGLGAAILAQTYRAKRRPVIS